MSLASALHSSLCMHKIKVMLGMPELLMRWWLTNGIAKMKRVFGNTSIGQCLTCNLHSTFIYSCPGMQHLHVPCPMEIDPGLHLWVCNTLKGAHARSQKQTDLAGRHGHSLLGYTISTQAPRLDIRYCDRASNNPACNSRGLQTPGASETAPQTKRRFQI